MPFSENMPKLSPTMEEGTVEKWHCKEGDKVEPGALLLEVTTDKATVEHNALDGGFLRKILVHEGEVAKVNQPIAVFTESLDESIDEFVSSLEKKEKPQPQKAEDKEKEVTIEKAPIKKSETSIGEPIFVPYPPVDDYFHKFSPAESSQRVKASPLARKLAKDKQLDLHSVNGSGPNGRIMSRDLSIATPLSRFSLAAKTPPKSIPGIYEEIPLTSMRKTIAKRLQQSKTFIPHFYLTQEIRVDALIELRESLKELGIKVTFNDFVVKATALALKDFPELNRGFNTQTQTIVQFKTIDISIAVSIEDGLITPIVRHADYKNLSEISAEVKDLAKKAKQGKLQLEEFQGGSFTVSNLGMFGIQDFVAVINPPQVAILAVGGIHEKAIVEQGKIVVGHTMICTLSVDHRVVDGAEAAKFLTQVQGYLEKPTSLIL